MVDVVIEYASELVGTPYGFWLPDQKGSVDDGPLWAWRGPPPSIETVRASSCSSSGLINLIRRFQGLSVPGVIEGDEGAGGTWIWFRYLRRRGRLQEFDASNKYPLGTLLIRDYTNEADPGHMAMITSIGRNSVLDEMIIHSYPGEPRPTTGPNRVGPGVTVSPLHLSHLWFSNGYYTHTVKPEYWLLYD
jgi:hypothetical protein